MNVEKLNDWLQVIGIFAVVVSLVFVGLEMNQTHEIALASTYNERASLTVDAHSSALGTSEYLSGMAKIYSGLRDQLTAAELLGRESG